MKDFNERFNTCRLRVAFWQKLSARLADIEALIRCHGHLTPEDVRVLKVIWRALSESYSRSQKAKDYHGRQLEKLRKEHVDESRTINEPR